MIVMIAALIRRLFRRRRPRPAPPRAHMIRDAAGVVVAQWSELTSDELEQDRRERARHRDELERGGRWLARRGRLR